MGHSCPVIVMIIDFCLIFFTLRESVALETPFQWDQVDNSCGAGLDAFLHWRYIKSSVVGSPVLTGQIRRA